MARFQLTKKAAMEVQHIMDQSSIDFSECTKQEYIICMYDSHYERRLRKIEKSIAASPKQTP